MGDPTLASVSNTIITMNNVSMLATTLGDLVRPHGQYYLPPDEKAELDGLLDRSRYEVGEDILNDLNRFITRHASADTNAGAQIRHRLITFLDDVSAAHSHGLTKPELLHPILADILAIAGGNTFGGFAMQNQLVGYRHVIDRTDLFGKALPFQIVNSDGDYRRPASFDIDIAFLTRIIFGGGLPALNALIQMAIVTIDMRFPFKNRNREEDAPLPLGLRPSIVEAAKYIYGARCVALGTSTRERLTEYERGFVQALGIIYGLDIMTEAHYRQDQQSLTLANFRRQLLDGQLTVSDKLVDTVTHSLDLVDGISRIPFGQDRIKANRTAIEALARQGARYAATLEGAVTKIR